MQNKVSGTYVSRRFGELNNLNKNKDKLILCFLLLDLPGSAAGETRETVRENVAIEYHKC